MMTLRQRRQTVRLTGADEAVALTDGNVSCVILTDGNAAVLDGWRVELQCHCGGVYTSQSTSDDGRVWLVREPASLVSAWNDAHDPRASVQLDQWAVPRGSCICVKGASGQPTLLRVLPPHTTAKHSLVLTVVYVLVDNGDGDDVPR